MRTEHAARGAGTGMQHGATERSPARPVAAAGPRVLESPSAAISARRQAAAAGWGHLRALRANLAATAERERAIVRRRRAAASAGSTIVMLAAVALVATCVIATTRSGDRLLASAHAAAAPGLSFDHARRLLIVATALTIVTVSTWLMLAVLRPTRGTARQPHGHRPQRPRPASRVQRHRAAIVLAAGVTPVLLGGGLPFAAKFLPIGLHIDTNSAVGTNLLDVVIGFAVPATLLSVLYFRWVARLASAKAAAAESTHATPPVHRPQASDPKHVLGAR